MIALDVRVLIAHLNPADPHHQAATAILLAGAPGQLLVHALTLAEVLVGGVRIGHGVSMRTDLRAAGIVVCPPDDDQPLRLAELHAGSGLTLFECCVLDIAVEHQANLATFNDALATAARRRGVVVQT